MWNTGEWNECSVSCGLGFKKRNVECRDGNGQLSKDCDLLQRPQTEKECKTATSIDCSNYELTKPLQRYRSEPIPEKLIDQPVPSQSTFIPDDWSMCSVTCGKGVRHRKVYCKIFLEFSRTIAKLPDHQCSGHKPVETERCTLKPCSIIENNLTYSMDTIRDSSFAEASLTNAFKPSSTVVLGSGNSGNYESSVKVAPGNPVQTSYSWKELGYTDCSATCLGGVQDLIITCIRDDTGKTVMPLLCTAETKPESRIRVCNDHPCPPRWNTSEFSPCMSPCGLGIQTREVNCIHEVTRGTGNTVTVPNHMCPQPPPVDRQYCNVWDCPVEWHVSEWEKCSKTCDGGIKKRKVLCEQVMAQGRKQLRSERDCSSSKPRTEKECNTRPCYQLNSNIQPIITKKNTTYIQNDSGKKVNLDIGGQATIFQGTPVIKIRCPVKKFDKARIIWRKNDEELQKSRKYKINKKGALKIIEVDFSDSGIYSCWAGQTNAVLQVTVKPKSRGLLNTEEVLRSGNIVHQLEHAHFISAPINSESFYDVHGEDNQQSRQDGKKLSIIREKPHGKKQEDMNNQLSAESTEKYDYSITPLHQPIQSTASSGASTLVPRLSDILTTFKSYWSYHDLVSPNSNYENFISYSHNAQNKNRKVTAEVHFPSYAIKHLQNSKLFLPKYRHNNLFWIENAAIPDNVVPLNEERVLIEDNSFRDKEIIFSIKHMNISTQPVYTESLLSIKTQPTNAQQKFHNTKIYLDRNQRDTKNLEIENKFYVSKKLNENDQENITTLFPKTMNDKISNNFDTEDKNSTNVVSDTFFGSSDSSRFIDLWSEAKKSTVSENLRNKAVIEIINKELIINMTTITYTENSPTEKNKERKDQQIESETNNTVKEVERTTKFLEIKNPNLAPLLRNNRNKNTQPTIGSIAVFTKDQGDLIYEWITTEWSRCSQTCGGGGFQMRGAQCSVRSAKSEINVTTIAHRTILGASMCEDANYPMPEKVRRCGDRKCPQWHSGSWTKCETSRCFNWKTAMQRREISCRLIEDSEDKTENSTNIDPSNCDETVRPPQRQECYNDACKGVWRVGEWSECTASCEKDGIKYRILQCVWYGTKKPAGNVCGDIPRPPVMKTCRGQPCSKLSGDCKDHSQLCSRVKLLGMCHINLYQKQCCKSCHQERRL